MTISDERRALEAIERIIRDNIVENDGPNRMKIGEDWHLGPVVDATFRMLRGLQQIASTGLSAIEQEQEPVAWGWADATGIRSTTLDKSQAEIWAGPNNTVVPLYLSPSVCEGKVTEGMVERVVRESQSWPTPMTPATVRRILTAALSQEGV